MRVTLSEPLLYQRCSEKSVLRNQQTSTSSSFRVIVVLALALSSSSSSDSGDEAVLSGDEDRADARGSEKIAFAGKMKQNDKIGRATIEMPLSPPV